MWKLTLGKQEPQSSTPPPELSTSRPRPVALTGTGMLVAFIGMSLPAAALVSGFWLHEVAVRDLARSKAIETQGVTVRGDVTELTRTREKSPRYIVAYRYFAGGRYRQGRCAIRRGEWSRLQTGSPISVGFLPAEPAQSWVTGYEPRGVPFWAGPVVALALALFAILPWSALRQQRVLLAEGTPTVAEVTSSRRIRSQHGAHYDVHYQFQTLSGSVVKGKYSSKRSPPPAGASITVLYDPDNPKRSGRYPFSLVRPVLASQL